MFFGGLSEKGRIEAKKYRAGLGINKASVRAGRDGDETGAAHGEYLTTPGRSSAGSYSRWNALYPVYVRGEAYLAAHEGRQAAAESQKILEHPGIVLNEPIGAPAFAICARGRDGSGGGSCFRSTLTQSREALCCSMFFISCSVQAWNIFTILTTQDSVPTTPTAALESSTQGRSISASVFVL